MTYQFSINSSKLLITNVKSSSDGTINIPTVYTVGLNNFVSNSIGPRNSIKITDMSGTLPTAGAAIQVAAWDVSGNAITESGYAPALNLYSFGTTVISGSDLAARFPLGAPMTYQFSINSSKLLITNVKSSSDGTINIPTVYAAGLNNFVSNSIGPRNSIKITDMSGTLPTAGAAIQVAAWEASGKEIPESGNPPALNLYNFGTTVISGSDLAARFPLGVPITYQFSIDSSKLLITNVKSSLDGTINIPTVFTIGPYGGM
jgi:C4-type Zn-finger protein